MLFVAPYALYAQDDCSIQNFNTSNGLQQNTIIGMTFDDEGYLWLGSQNGLIRYDGTSFKTFFFDSLNHGANGSNTVLNIFNIPAEKKVLIRTRAGMVYTVKNGRPLLYSDALKNTIYYYEMQGYFPNLALFDKFNLPIYELTKKHNWNASIKAVLPVNKTDFIALSNRDSTLLYYKEGVWQKDVHIVGRWKQFLKSGDYCFIVDDKNNLHLYDARLNVFRKVNVDRRGIIDKDQNIIDAAFYWDQPNNQAYYLYNSVFYLLTFDAAKNSIGFTPRFTMKEKGHFWTRLIYDSVSSTFFLSTFTEGIFQVKLKKL